MVELSQNAENIISIQKLKKVYSTEDGDKIALHDVDLNIEKGDIYGIIGLSGAGKSTLVRCVNGLERYDGGSVSVEGREIASLGKRDLRTLRRSIGMIFQTFNLMPSRSVAENVELALLDSGLAKRSRSERVAELLELVHLSDKGNDYPSELSGGQKQRVAIARALANRPDILLSDEATSALDPNTTKSILRLLKDLHDTLGLTIVIITHQMSVIKRICNRVAVIDLFANPRASLTRAFVSTASNLGKVNDLLDDGSELVSRKPGWLLLRMKYAAKGVSEALVSHISRTFGIDVNIIFGDIDVVDGAPLGGLVVIFEGTEECNKAAIDYLKTRNVEVEVLAR